MRDPRPHVGEPLALDLLNTRWMSPDGPRDLLENVDGLQIWLEANGLDRRCVADEKMRLALLRAREAVLRVVADDDAAELNDSAVTPGRDPHPGAERAGHRVLLPEAPDIVDQ
ncbi:ABATE domain-containing protein, partial [Mycolicibacterium diernhoferi]|uniref:ABATE domain-containing protein n=1 Tax=Mycolicibacterium diernhoferi TaxID=1801 RepID=UPI00197C97D4